MTFARQHSKRQWRALLLGALLASASLAVQAATFPANSSVFFQTNGCQRAASIGDWYTSAGSASTTRYSEFFLEVTIAMAPATVVIQDAESTDGGGGEAIDDEILNASDPTRFELRSGDGTTLITGTTIASGSPNGTTVTFAGLGVGIYRIRSYTGSDQVPGLATGAYCDQAVGDNDDDNAFVIQVNGSAAVDGLLGFLQTTYQHNAGAAINYQMYFMVGPSASDVTLQLRNFDLDGGASGTRYNRPPDATGAVTNGTVSGNGVWNGGGSLNAGQDSVGANNDIGSGAIEAGAWGYRIEGWTQTNQTIFEANNTGARLALSDTLPGRAGFFTISPDTVRNTVIGTFVDHPFSVENQFFTDDLINFTLTGTSANYTVLLRTDPNCDGNGADGTTLPDTDNNGQPDSGVLGYTGSATDSACFVLRTTPAAGASVSDSTRVNAISLMDSRVGSGNTTRFVTKLTLLPPAISKAFSPNPMAVNGISTLTFTLSNPNTIAITGAAFSDTYPAGLVNAAAPTVTNSCGGSSTGGAAGGNSVGLSAGTIPASSNCTVTVRVTASAAGNYPNTSSVITSANAGSGSTANATLIVQAMVPPSIAKSFSANPIAINGTTVLTLTISNSNATALTGVAVSDTYPAGLVNTATPGVTNTCGGSTTGGVAGGNSIGLTGATLVANSSCTVTVNVTSASNNSYLNTTTAVSSSNGGVGNMGSATLFVHAPPTVTKAFSPDTINVGTPSVLTITLSNPNSTAMTNAAFTDTYPAGIVNTGVPGAATTCGGTATAAAAGGSVALSGGTLPANASCVVTVSVTSNTAGSRVNTIPAGGLATTGGISNTVAATATLIAQAIAPPTLTKSFAPDPIQNGGTSTLTLILGNPNITATLVGVAVSDTYPAALSNRTPASPALSCTAGSSATITGGVDAGNTIGLTAGSIQPGGTCTVTVQVTSTTNGTHTNTTGAVTSSNGGTGSTASDTLTVQAGSVPPTISKVFSLDELGLNGIATLSFTISNPNNVTLFNVGFTDTYPAGLVNAATPAVSSNCDNVAGGTAGTTGGVAGGNTIGLAGPGVASPNDMPANSTCTLTVSVTSATAGIYNNTSGAISGCATAGTPCSAANTRTGLTASDTITFVRPTITKSFGPDPIASGGTATLTIVLSHDSDVAFSINTPGFTDTFPVAPGAITVATPLTASTTCGGTLLDNAGGALAAGDAGIRLNGGSIPAHGSCQVTVNVTASAGGTYTNTIAAGNLSTSGGTNAAAASDTLSIPSRPTIAKSFSPTAMVSSGVSTLTITLGNSNGTAATSAIFTDTLPAGLTTAGMPSTNCGGTVSVTTTSVSLSGGTIPAGAPGSCTVTVNVTATASGAYVNTIAAGDLSTSHGTNAAAASATLTVIPPLTVLKTSAVISDPFNGATNPKSIPGAVIQYTLVISNSGGSIAVDNVVMTDVIPANTTYVAGSLIVAGVAEDDDAGGADETDPNGADFALTTAGAVTMRLPSIAAGASATVTFRVMVN